MNTRIFVALLHFFDSLLFHYDAHRLGYARS